MPFDAEIHLAQTLKRLERARGALRSLERNGACSNELALAAEDLAGQADRVAYWANKVADIYASRAA